MASGVTWLKNPSRNCICPPFPYVASPFSVGAFQPSAMWPQFHQRVSKSEGAISAAILCIYGNGRRNRQLWTPNAPLKQSRISQQLKPIAPFGTQLQQLCPQGGPCVWIWLSCVTPFLSHNWKEILLEEGMVYPPCGRHTSVRPVRSAFRLLTVNSMFPLRLMKSILTTDKHDR